MVTGRVYAVGLIIIILAIIASALAVYFRNKRSLEKAKERGWSLKGDLNKTQEKALLVQNGLAAAILRDLLAPPTDVNQLFGEMTLLSDDHRKAAELWLQNQSSLENIRKVIERS